MRSNNLVPKPITDKNGVTRTHWVVPEGSDASRKPLPAPLASFQAKDEQSSVQLMAEALHLLYPDGCDRESIGYQNLWFLAQHAPQQMQLLNEQCSGNDALRDLWIQKMDRVTMFSRETSRKMSDEQKRDSINGLLAIWTQRLHVYPLGMELIERLGDHWNNPGLLREYTNKLEREVYNLLWSRPLSQRNEPVPDETLEALALIGIIRGIYGRQDNPNDNSGFNYKSVSADIDYIQQHVDEVREVVPELVKRGRYDLALIKEMVNGPARSLTSGML